MPISIDGADINDCTIDGQEVQEITIDGAVAWERAYIINHGYYSDGDDFRDYWFSGSSGSVTWDSSYMQVNNTGHYALASARTNQELMVNATNNNQLQVRIYKSSRVRDNWGGSVRLRLYDESGDIEWGRTIRDDQDVETYTYDISDATGLCEPAFLVHVDGLNTGYIRVYWAYVS